MTIHELINMSSQKVRGNSDLMAFYVNEFKKQFGKEPNCAGCTFSTDFIKLKKAVEKGNKPLKQIQMKTDTTFQLNKRQGKILSYKKDKRTIRTYDNKMSEDFAIAFLTYGTKEEIAERRKLFKVLPETIRVKTEKKAERSKPAEKITVVEEKKPTTETSTKEAPKKETKKPKSNSKKSK